ncbi:hypothetical protein LTR84_013108 [Exophiala bonariae]|uniref:Multicopper oxidase n=1 Tax=Exophiala bonariae TaxID=1690606 RepID=A0AAV9NHN3_9EURO|nr:hypothetical protein LTR84_013108 [Exophiala bonariae]
MHHSLILFKLFVFLFATSVAAEGFKSSRSSTTALYTPSTTSTKSRSTSWSSSSKYNVTTTTHTTQTNTHTSSKADLTSVLPQSISDLLFPTVLPQHPILPKNIPSGRGALPQSQTNGKGLLGAIGQQGAPKYPPFVGSNLGGSGGYAGVSSGSGNRGSNGGAGGSSGSFGLPGRPGRPNGPGTGSSPPPGGFPWGGRTVGNTNPYRSPPKTGVVRKYQFVVERATLAPDGVATDLIVINGAFPGPTIEVNWGDDVEVTVINKITGPTEGVSIHWHGLLQTGTPYEDGVPGITQCPIAPGQTFTYRFNADLYGTSWYHSHYSAQYAAGIFGAMIIHGPTQVDYDEDLGPVLINDYYHREYYDIVEDVMGTDLSKIVPFSDNNLINGKGTYDCSTDNTTTCTSNAGYSKFQFQTGKKYRMRLINAGAEGIQKFSIDGHNLTVMAYDFVPIVPYSTNIITLGIGQRADVIVEATGSAKDAYWLRSTISNCSLAHQPNAYAMIFYQNADTNGKPNSKAWVDTTDSCANDDLSKIVPYFSITPPANPAKEITVDINFGLNATGHLLWLMNNSTFRTDYNDPALYRAHDANSSFTYPEEWNVYDFGSASSVRVVINNLTPVAHPMHIHGHNMYVLAEGVGEWNGAVVRPSNPTRRDVQQLRPAAFNKDGSVTPAHMVFQIDADNPGMWPFHCHIAWHVSGGLYINLLERPADIPKINIPAEATALCKSWNDYTSLGPIDQIDSGL